MGKSYDKKLRRDMKLFRRQLEELTRESFAAADLMIRLTASVEALRRELNKAGLTVWARKGSKR